MKPRLLDLFCGAGGAAMGYQRAGFEVVGIDLESQPNYCGDGFYRAEALELVEWLWATGGWPPGPFPSHLFAAHFHAIHASPPCQHYANVTKWRGDPNDHPDLIDPVRKALDATGLPWVMENVPTKELRSCFQLCGSMFGLPIRRHRFFETSWKPLELMPPCRHHPDDLAFEHKGERAYADAMGCGWMTAKEARQAIPPAYTAHIGGLLMAEVQREVAA